MGGGRHRPAAAHPLCCCHQTAILTSSAASAARSAASAVIDGPDASNRRLRARKAFSSAGRLGRARSVAVALAGPIGECGGCRAADGAEPKACVRSARATDWCRGDAEVGLQRLAWKGSVVESLVPSTTRCPALVRDGSDRPSADVTTGTASALKDSVRCACRPTAVGAANPFAPDGGFMQARLGVRAAPRGEGKGSRESLHLWTPSTDLQKKFARFSAQFQPSRLQIVSCCSNRAFLWTKQALGCLQTDCLCYSDEHPSDMIIDTHIWAG